MILIRDGTLVDGTGKPGRRADVLLKGDRILAIGTFPKKRAEFVVDALGMTVAPGFIDAHSESDHYLSLFTNPGHEDLLAQGVTTVIGGQCGASLAPLLYGSLESIRKWCDPNAVNVGWRTIRELAAVLGRLPLGVNFATLAGHSTIRRAILGDVSRDLTVRELAVLRRVADEALVEGALGLSFGLSYAHTRETPFSELEALGGIAAARGRTLAIHLRNEAAGAHEAMREALQLAARAGARLVVSHLRPLAGFEHEYGEALAEFDRVAAARPIWFDTSAIDRALSPLYLLLPEWERRGTLETMTAGLGDAHRAERILAGLSPLPGGDLSVVRAPGAEELEGVSLKDFAAHRGIRGEAQALLELMRATRLRAVVLVRRGGLDLKLQSIAYPRALAGSHEPSFPQSAPARVRALLSPLFTQYLERVTALKLLTFSQAIARLTSAPAEAYGLAGRGILREGAAADLVVLDGVRAAHVFVNGVHAVRAGAPTADHGGRVLLRA